MSAPNPSTALATVLVDEFVRLGVVHAVLAPGSRSASLALALAADERVELHVCVDERSAAFLGLGIARATGLPAVVACTSGTAAANFFPAVVEADRGRVPLIVVTADRPEELRDTEANQTIDQVKLYGESVRFFHDIAAPEGARAGLVGYWRSTAARAMAEASGSPQGPVHLNVAFREPLTPEPVEGFELDLAGRPGGKPWTTVTRPPRPPGRSDVDGLAELVASTERGVFVAGACGVPPRPLVGLAARAGWPLLAEPTSGIRFGDCAISTYEALLRDAGFAAAHRPDVVVQVGKTGLSRALARWIPSAARHVLVDSDGAWLDPQRTLAEIVVADPSSLTAEVDAQIGAGRENGWLESWLDGERRARKAIDHLLDAHPDACEPRAARDVAAALPPGANLVVGSSLPVRDLDSFMAPREGLQVHANRGVNGIDGFVSTALGVALGSKRPTAALCGDLTMLHDHNGLLIGRTEEPSCVFVVLNNDGGGIFSFLEQAAHPEHFERVFGTPQAIDFARVATLFDASYRRAEKASELGPAVMDALQTGGVTLIEVRTDRDANVSLHRRLWTAVSESLRA